MGGLCSKSSSRSRSPDPFAQPGRTLGSAPPPRAGTVPVPPKIRGGGRVGGGGGNVGGGGGLGQSGGGEWQSQGTGGQSQGQGQGQSQGQGQRLGGATSGGSGRGDAGGDTYADARRAAARAAEERAAKAQRAPTGKLGRDLASQKAQARTDTLENISKEERRRRDADGVAEARNWN